MSKQTIYLAPGDSVTIHGAPAKPLTLSDQFFAYVREQDQAATIDHGSWKSCAIGDFCRHHMDPIDDNKITSSMSVELLADIEKRHPRIYDTINYRWTPSAADISTYGRLTRYIDKNYEVKELESYE